MTPLSPEARLEALRASLAALTRAIAEEETQQGARIALVLPQHRQSATNLAHYLALRSSDVRDLQLELANVALSSLGRSEGHVRDTLNRLSAWLAGDRAAALSDLPDDDLDSWKANETLRANTTALFGQRPRKRHVYIMVTAPDASAATESWADEILHAGADLLRINGAHGSPADWGAITATFKQRAAALGKPGRVIVDLPGPKFRADIHDLAQGVVHAPRNKDRLGRTVSATRVRLVAEFTGGLELPIPADWLALLQAGDVLRLTDAGGRRRRLVVQSAELGTVFATCERSLYLTSNLPLAWQRGKEELAEGRVGFIPSEPRAVSLAPGDVFLLQAGEQDAPAGIAVLVFPDPELLRQVKTGQRVILDDGRLVAVVEATSSDGLRCRVQQAIASPTRLRSGKGVSFPDSEIAGGLLSQDDNIALSFALEAADAVGVSFVNSAADVTLVGDRIRSAGKTDFGMLLKLETRGAMNNLAAILFEALRYHPVGLMIARGDLAVELSFERLAEMQEEILWFGEACHLPVVWATQVLDTLAHTGVPTRAEVTDAAMSMRAECVMLNKGPHIADATRMLADIIGKMEDHQYKKRALYRQLSVAKNRAP